MEKKQLQTFSVWAKNNLEEQIKVSLSLLGIKSDTDIKRAYLQGDFTVIEGDSKSYPKDLKRKRDSIVEHIKTDGYNYVIEEFAYTWFNRIIALRFMEVHDYLPHGYKIFPKQNGSIEPEILSKLQFVKDDLDLDMNIVAKYKDESNIEELYRYFLFKQCNALSNILPMLFAKEMEYLELMLPLSLLKGNTIISEVVKIDEKSFLDDVEIIGWLYQFYISVKKDEVFSSKEKITKESLPAVTQLFTPRWIARYLVENSLGRLWLENNELSRLKDDFDYYIDDDNILKCEIKNIPLDSIKIIDPCCGSGHLLLYAFDVLFKIYIELGYSRDDIPKRILKNNLIGLDIDKRASQLASFALIMKARSVDNRFFAYQRFFEPNILEIKDSKLLNNYDYLTVLSDLNVQFKNSNYRLLSNEINQIKYVVENFSQAKVIGSLLKLKEYLYKEITFKLKHMRDNAIRGIFNNDFIEFGLKRIIDLLNLANILTTKYDVMITNPPYVALSSFEGEIKDYANKFYSESKKDMYAMFMDTSFVKPNGYIGMINQHQWMFITSFEKLRKKLLSNLSIISMLHLGSGAFEAISGEVVQSTSFVLKNSYNPDYMGKYIRLVDYKDKQIVFLNKLKDQEYYKLKQRYFKDFPSSSIIYWMKDDVAQLFSNNKRINYYGDCKSGIMTGDDKEFIRLWFEVNPNNIACDNKLEHYEESTKKWFSLNTGGFQKWYGNNTFVVNLYEKGKNIRFSGKNYRLRDNSYYFRKGICWSEISTGSFSARIVDDGSLFSSTSPMLFLFNDDYVYQFLGILNSSVSEELLKMLNPTLHYNVSSVAELPFEPFKDKEFIDLVKDNISICKKYWNNNETSYGFKHHPLLNYVESNIQIDVKKIMIINEVDKDKLRKNEDRINQIVKAKFNVYSIKDNYVSSISKFSEAGIIRTLVSYLVGLLFGRFSYERLGGLLTYDKIPISHSIYSDQSLTYKLLFLIKELFGNENFKENVEYITSNLFKKSHETVEECLNRYLSTNFIRDHISMYTYKNLKLPIYWMMTSGKLGAFKCLIYMHKYNEDTLAKINSELFLPETARVKYELEDLTTLISVAEDKEKRKLEKRRNELQDKYDELLEYGIVLDHMANRYISIDLDDGVKVNYAKFQGVEIVTDSGRKIKKDLFVPLK